MKRVLGWTTIAWLAFAILQVYGIRRQGLTWGAVLAEAPYWLLLFPPFFITIYFFTGGQKAVKAAIYRAGVRAARRVRPGRPATVDSLVVCSRCGLANAETALRCQGCDLPLHAIDTMDALEFLPGVSHTTPSLLYAGAVVASLGFGSLVLLAIGEERFLESIWLLVGGFMTGAGVSLAIMFFLIGRWARAKYAR